MNKLTKKARPMQHFVTFSEAVRLYREAVPNPQPFEVDRAHHRIGKLEAYRTSENRYIVQIVALNRLIRRAKEYQEKERMSYEERLKMVTFTTELKALLKKYRKDKVSITPDFVLADFIERCLGAYESAVSDRAFWLKEEEIKPSEIDTDL